MELSDPKRTGVTMVKLKSIKLETKVYGGSDDLVEFSGGIHGEIGCYDTSEEDSILVAFSDGTVLSIWYSKHGIGKIHALRKGELLKMIVCAEDDEPTDVALFSPGLKWAVYATKWEQVA